MGISSSTTGIGERGQLIVGVITDVKESKQSARRYFSTHDVPFSLRQYQTYLKAYKEKGINGLYDHREDGNARKIAPEIEHYLIGLLENNRELSVSDIISQINKRFEMDVKPRTINNFRKTHGLERIIKPVSRIEEVQFAGFEIISALAYHTGIVDAWSDAIKKHIESVKDTDLFKENRQLGADHSSERNKGRFTADYNKLNGVRTAKFDSIEEKIRHKDLSRLQLLDTQTKTILRKNLAVLSLPLITLNGSMRDINKSIGNALKQICGYNYKHATIDKYLRELKYLRISSNFIKATADFWIKFWAELNNEHPTLLCYYLDGNTKPLWSSKSCKKSKVTMLGRVMNCLEQVFVHDSFGNPTYFQTYSGNADLGSKALSLMEDIEDYLKAVSSDGKVNRVMIMDSAANGVSTLRSIANANYYFITLLNENQINPRKFKHIQPPVRYEHGDADLGECAVELIDSKEPDYIFECRGIIIDWDKGKQTVAVTNLPTQIIDGSGVVKSYFDRWPSQELQFRSMKSAVSIHKVMGYGKKKIPDENMREKQEQVRKGIDKICSELKDVLDELGGLDQELVPFYKEERMLKETTAIKDGEREGDANTLSTLETCQKEINRIKRSISKLKKPHKTKFGKLQKLRKEWKRIQGKDHIYVVDVELDQLITCFRMSFVNLCSFFLSHCIEDGKMELQTLIQSFFMLGGSVTETTSERVITLNRNPKEPDMMGKLALGLDVLNSFNIMNVDGKKYSFQLM